MKLKILGSSSRGNCYILETETEALIIEAGVNTQKVKQALNFDGSKVVGCLITHEHLDHAKYIGYLLDLGIKVYASSGTYHKFTGNNWPERYIIKEDQEKYMAFNIGGFKIKAFKTFHDAAEPLGFLIEHEEIGRLLFCTDSRVIPYRFNGLNHILIEANYSFDLVNESSRRNRVFTEHMEIGTTIDFLKRTDLSNVHNIVLIHLSNENSHAMNFAQKVKEVFFGNIFIADEDVNIELRNEPF